VPRRASALRPDAVLLGLAGPTSDTDETTDTLLDAAAELLAAHGLRRWSMEDVAERAGLGRATVYRRFASREALVHAALGREVRRFFAATAEAVQGLDSIEDQVIDGFLAGWRIGRDSMLGELFAGDRTTAVSLLTATPVLTLARAALVERYQIVTGTTLAGQEATDAELVAEVLVRLGLSFLLMPVSVIDLDDTAAARTALRRLLGPLLTPPMAARRQSGR
jgi:AcrR family transcriptional regulator